MKRILSISVVFIVVAAGSYFLWKINNPPAIKAWDLVSQETLIVYQYNKNLQPDLTDLLIQSWVPDSIRKRVLDVNELLISAHSVSKEEFGVILYLSGSPQVDKVSAVLKSLARHERIFEGFKISETPVGSKTVSSVTIDQILVISSTSLLIEDVIRLAKAKERQNFILDHPGIFRLARMNKDSGSVYLNFSRLSKVMNVFLADNNQNPILEHFARSGVVEFKKQKQELLLTGFITDSLTRGGSILSLFNRQRPVAFKLHQIISSRAGGLIHFGITDYNAWNQDRLAYSTANNPAIPDSLKTLNAYHGFSTERFYQGLGDEAGVCQAGIFSGEVFILKLKNVPQALTELKKLQPKKESATASTENYSHFQIHGLAMPALARVLFWPLTNKDMNYYLVTEHHLIFSENLEDLKSFVNDMELENTWGKSSEWNSFLSTSQDTNVGIIFDALNLWPSLRNNLTAKWLAFGDSTRFLNFNKGSFQFSRLENKYYFNGTLRFNTRLDKAAAGGKEKVLEISLTEKIHPRLDVVRNHNTRSGELLVQDEANNLMLFSSKLKNLFTTKVNGRIRSEIHQIDIYKNKKLQYCFATDRSICLVDRLGNTVKGFPKIIPGNNPIQFLTVLDFDNSKNYRFLMADTQGNLTQVDREGKVLRDWKPVGLQGDLRVAPRALRALGKDWILAVTTEGVVYGFGRKGEPMKGFPVNLKVRPAGNWILDKTEGREFITLVSEDGVLVQVDLHGKIVNKNNLIKSSAASRFSLVASPDLDRYVISRIDQQKMAILNNRGDVVFEKENPGSDELFLTYFDAGRGRRLFGFTDPQQEFTYIFDEKGKSLFSKPLEDKGIPAIITEKSGEIFFYGHSGSSIRRYRLR